MANRSNNIWAKAAAGSPGTNIARAQQSRWTGIPNETAPQLAQKMRIPQYPNHAKTSRQVPPSHYGLAPAGLPDGPDVPGGSRWPRVSGACTGAQAASSKYSQRMSLASLCPAQTSPLGWRSRRRLPLPASLHILNAAMPKAVGA